MEPDAEEVLEGYGAKLLEADIRAAIKGTRMDVGVVVRRTAARSLSGTLRVSVHRLGTNSRLDWGAVAFSLDAAQKKVTVPLDAPTFTTPGELGAWVLAYVVELPDGTLRGWRSLYMAAGRHGVAVVGNNRYAVGQKGVLRVMVTNPGTGAAEEGVDVTINFRPDSSNNSRTLASGKTNKLGVFAGTLTFAAAEMGAGKITVHAGPHRSTHSVLIERQRQVLLTTDKPMYQPGQTVFIRALAMGQPGIKPVAGEALVMEVEDPKGTKIFKEQTKTDAHGIASLRFKLARLVNLGAYTARVSMGTTVRQKGFQVARYTLPKFKVKVTTLKTWYAPGDDISGTVQADYFFGKPVKGAAVKLTLRAVGYEKALTEVLGKTDAKGSYVFKVPTTMSSRLSLEAVVTDSAGAEARGSAAVLVTSSAHVLQLIGERSEVATGDEVSLFLLLTDPVGKPLAGTVTLSDYQGGVTFGGKSSAAVTLSSSGLAAVKAKIVDCDKVFAVNVQAAHGLAKRNLSLRCAKGKALRLSTDAALYKEGDTAKITVQAPAKVESASLDVVRRNATIKTVQVKLSAGKGTAQLKLGGELGSTLQLTASCLLGGEALWDQKLIHVRGTRRLTVKVTTDKKSYRPAGKAKVTLALTDHAGSPAPGALGVQVVDEALYALTEFKPGLERRFFFLEQEVIAAGNKLKFVSPSTVLADAPTADDQLRARMLFAAAGDKATFPIDYRSTGSDLKTAIAYSRPSIDPLSTRLEEAFLHEFGNDYPDNSWGKSSRKSWIEKWLALRVDAFGSSYRFRDAEFNSVVVTGAGMDEKHLTADDLVLRWSIHLVKRSYGDDDTKKKGGVPVQLDGGAWAMDASSADAGVDMLTSKPDAGVATDGGSGTDGGGSTPRIRQYFPETLYVNPALITDKQGKANIDLALADSITTWRLSTIAHTKSGQLGSAAAGITVFQEFFCDTLLPPHLLQGDEVEVPVAVYNYTNSSQTVTVTVKSEAWFTLLGVSSKQVTVPARSVGSARFRLRADKVGTFGFTATGVSATDSDGVKRAVQVLPDGVRKEIVYAGLLRAGKVAHTVSIPAAAIDGASELLSVSALTHLPLQQRLPKEHLVPHVPQL